jgi:hypothetical protein
MLSAIMVIGACVMVLAAVCGLIATGLLFVNRIKMLFKAFRDCGLTIAAARDGFHAIVTDAKTRPGSYLLGIAIFGSFAFFAEYILLGLVALGAPAILLAAIGRWRALGIEKRAVRHASCPLFMTESHLAMCDGGKATG